MPESEFPMFPAFYFPGDMVMWELFNRDSECLYRYWHAFERENVERAEMLITASHQAWNWTHSHSHPEDLDRKRAAIENEIQLRVWQWSYVDRCRGALLLDGPLFVVLRYAMAEHPPVQTSN